MLRIRIWTLNWEKYWACLSRIVDTHITSRRTVWFCCTEYFVRDHTAFKNSLGKLLKHLCMMAHMREVEHVARSPSICRTWKEAGPGQSRRDEMGNKIDRLEKKLIFVEGSGFYLGCELLQKGDSKIWKCKYGWKRGFDPQDWADWELSLP